MILRVAATTIGCKVNLYDTQTLLARFAACGYEVVDFRDKADVYIINTCAVTNVADKKSRQMVGRAKGAKERNPRAIVAVMGCASQADFAKYRELGIDIVVGTEHRDKLLTYANSFVDKTVRTSQIETDTAALAKPPAERTSNERTRAFLKIQDGCNNFCAYCIIPYVRGLSRSRPFAEVLKEAQELVNAGFKEIVVGGIHVASYGKDLDKYDLPAPTLLNLLKEISVLKGLKRLRLSSIEPTIINQDFCDFIERTPNFCNHLHLSLQSGCDAVLKRMNRKYTTKQYEAAIKALRKASPEINITTDIIAGFPGETEDEHNQTLDFAGGLGLSKLHVFPFSPKKGTKAADMPNQTTKAIKTRRAKELIQLSNKLEKAYFERFIGRVMSVLIEEKTADGFYLGKTTNYIPIAFKGGSFEENTIIDLKIGPNNLYCKNLENVL
jgi:threonylcarbamoyladenosine tRNA methylthiotransferase MtaB